VIYHGKPRFSASDTRLNLEFIKPEEIMTEYEDLEREDILTALDFALLTQRDKVHRANWA
jgi:uncharacterized protein (DUF433 family)